MLFRSGEIEERALPVGMLPHIVHQIVPDILGLGLGVGHVGLFQQLQVLQGLHLKMGVFIVKVFLEQFLPLQADAVIEAPEVQDKVKDVVAGDDPAVLRNGPAGLEAAHFRVILEEIGTVVRGLPPDSRLLRNHVQGGGLAGAVPAVEDGNRLKVQPSQPMPGQRLEGIEGVIAGSLDSDRKSVV